MDWSQQLQALLAPPAFARSVEAETSAVERALQLSLPDDYKAFIRVYGIGTIDEFLTVLSPAARLSHLRLDAYGSKMLEVLRGLRAGGETIPYAIYPETRGLLPWGVTSNGDWGYWITDRRDDPNRWPVAINVGRGLEWYEHPGPLTRLVVELLERTVTVPFFPDDVPSGAPAFRPRPDAV